MKSRWVAVLAGVVAAVVLGSIALGLTTPDGSVGDKPASLPSRSATPTSTPTSTATPTPTPTPTTHVPSVDLAPAELSKPWPGRPARTTLKGEEVNWCPAVRLRGAGEATREFGVHAVDAAACTAVRFVFEQRYSRLAIPRSSYSAGDLAFVLSTLSESTARAVYRPRIAAFLADPNSVSRREALGLVLFRGEGTRAGAEHAVAGSGRVFYGKAYTTSGYRNRAAWINPTWSTVSIAVDRAKAEPRIVATFSASAAMPVFNLAKRRDDMLTVPTEATFYLRNSGDGHWKIGGWHISSGTYEFATLKVK